MAERSSAAPPHLYCQSYAYRKLLCLFMSLNPALSNISLRSFPILPTTTPLLQSRPAHCSRQSRIPSLQWSKSSPPSLQVPPAWFLCELFAAWPALGTSFSFSAAIFPSFVCCSGLAGLKSLFSSALAFLTSEEVQKYRPHVDDFFLLEHGRQMKTGLIQGRV